MQISKRNKQSCSPIQNKTSTDPFTKCISRINNKDIDTAQDTDFVMPMYNLIEYSDKYSKRSESLWQYYKDDSNNNLADTESFKSKVKITGKDS